MSVTTEPVGAVQYELGKDAGGTPRGEKRRASEKLVTHPHNSPSNLRVLKYFLAGFFLAAASSAVLADDAAPAHVPGLTAGNTTPAPVRAPPDFVPFVIDRAQYEAVMDHLNTLPFKTALPLVKWLGELEDRAKAQWAADNAPKEASKP